MKTSLIAITMLVALVACAASAAQASVPAAEATVRCR